MAVNQSSGRRLEGLDLARFLALVGMVIVNFDVVMVGIDESAAHFAILLQGRAAVTFVVLAGIGFSLSAKRGSVENIRRVTLKRVFFLAALGMANMLIFPADIIHYYAFYFLLGLAFLRVNLIALISWCCALMLLFPVLVMVLDYDAGWDWTTGDYFGLWTPDGFVRNLVFNGWHPIVPWLAFFLFGMLLGRAALAHTRFQVGLAIVGGVSFSLSTALALLLKPVLGTIDPELAYFVGAEPIPPMPLFVIAGCGFASMVIGLCLLVEKRLASWRLNAIVVPAGRQTLTLYIAHILIGMGVLEAAGLVGGQTPSAALTAAILYCVAATVFAYLWSRRFKRGPLESVMRWLTG
ncbi:DUF418 domain-containing protein [Hoeflea prorocentri]|uniref:DUF418 domain-containing protein n=1 Tax=Hoeflea prorocentri TaxID=1922333 RepID=A0A9X3ZHQ7_9HYPH|nr:DUF418 domain-containing protein [Hoeflea prorocentri]MCY6381076.1 DUF418 domain-containing protein [Hoeflea prorocentri]MDA5398876.1 DUF418 domain-containing protein [Hoeflea prorocentri]